MNPKHTLVKSHHPPIKLTPKERSILKAKIEMFSMPEILDAAIEEVLELAAELLAMKILVLRGDLPASVEIIKNVGREYSDVQTAVGETFAVMYNDFFTKEVVDKRTNTYSFLLPEHIRKATPNGATSTINE